MLLPVQETADGVTDLDGELAFALRTMAPGTEWLDVTDLDRVVAGAGRLGADPRELRVGVFQAGEVERIGDPLFGDLYRLSAFVDAGLVVLPLRAHLETDEEGGAATVLEAALLVPRTGRVLWQGIVRGDPVAAGAAGGEASAAERLAARLLR